MRSNWWGVVRLNCWVHQSTQLLCVQIVMSFRFCFPNVETEIHTSWPTGAVDREFVDRGAGAGNADDDDAQGANDDDGDSGNHV